MNNLNTKKMRWLDFGKSGQNWNEMKRMKIVNTYNTKQLQYNLD